MDPKLLSPAGHRALDMIEFDKDEKLLREIRKHPIGLVFIYITGAFVTFLLTGIAILTAALLSSGDLPESSGFSNGAAGALVIALCIFLAALSVIATAIAAYLFRSNVILVTSDKLAQLLNPSLFNRKISQLNINDVQDVTVTQRGILPHAFNYGTLVVETAGEQQNYTFSLVPDPYATSKTIIGAHEKNVARFGN